MGVADLPTVAQMRAKPSAKPKPDSLVDDAKKDRSLAMADLEWRMKVKTRDEWHCQICGCAVQRTINKVPNRAEADHIYTKGAHPELRHEVDNGVTECLRCHRKAQQDRSLIPDWIRARAELCYRRVVLGEANPERPLL